MNGADAQFLRDEARATVRRPVATVEVIWAGRDVDDATVDVRSSLVGLYTSGDNRVSAPQQTLKGIGTRRRWFFVETDAPAGDANAAGALEWPRSVLMNEDGDKDDPAVYVLMPDINGNTLLPDTILGIPIFGRYPNGSTGGNGINAGGYMVGWRGRGSLTSDWLGFFGDAEPTLRIRFSATEVSEFVLEGDAGSGEFPVDFSVVAFSGDVVAGEAHVTGNDLMRYSARFNESMPNVDLIIVSIHRWNKAGSFVKITRAFDRISAVYDGSEISALSVLEESDGAVGVLPIGSISSNEMDLSLQNVDDKFFRGNTASPLNMLARFGRRIEPAFGFKDGGGQEVYAPKGVYWSGDWTIPEQGTAASTSAVDRLGLMQEIEYNGQDGFTAEEVMADRTVWEKGNLYDIATDVLTWLRQASGPMLDLEFTVDDRLRDVVIPIAFFDRQPYFDVVRSIAAAGSCFAYMDVPTEAERAAAALRGNERCADILRIKSFDYFGPSAAIADAEISETVTKRDYTTKTPSMRRDDVVNIITVPYQLYVIGENGVPEKSGDEMIISRGVRASIAEYGRKEFAMSTNALIQTQELAAEIADNTLKMFSGAPITASLETFGDVTRRLGDVVNLPEYLKGAINTRGYYALTKIQTEYGDGLRQNITCRRLGDAD